MANANTATAPPIAMTVGTQYHDCQRQRALAVPAGCDRRSGADEALDADRRRGPVSTVRMATGRSLGHP